MSLSRPELEELERLTNRALRYTEEHPGEADDLDLPEWPAELLQFVEATSPENVAALLESASFAELAAAFLREHGAEMSAHLDPVWEFEKLHALAELLRSLPAQPAKEKPDAP